MHMMKRMMFIALALLTALLLTGCSAKGPAEAGRAIVGREAVDDYRISVYDNGNCRIDEYRGNPNTQRLVVPEKIGGHRVAAIGSSAFDSVPKVGAIILPDCCTVIERSAFSGCPFLQDVQLPASCVSIGESAFSGTCLNRIVLPEGLVHIDPKALQGVYPERISLPASLEWPGPELLGNQVGLKTITVAEGHPYLKVVDGALMDTRGGMTLLHYPGGSPAWRYEVPAGTTAIADYAFSTCQELDKVVVPEGVTAIGERAFIGLSQVILPASVTTIGEYAFGLVERGSDAQLTVPAGSCAEQYARENGYAYVTE